MLLFARPMHQREAVLAPEMDVQEHRFRQGFRRNKYECRFESVSEYGFKTFGFQPAAQEFAIHRLVFNDENAMFHFVSRGRRHVNPKTQPLGTPIYESNQ